MADTKISALASASTPLAGTEVLPIVQSSATVKATIENVLNSAQPSGTANGVQYLNGSKQGTTSANFTYDGTNVYLNTTSGAGMGGVAVKKTSAGSQCFSAWNSGTSGTRYLMYFGGGSTFTAVGSITHDGTNISYNSDGYLSLGYNGTTEGFRLNTSGNLVPVTPAKGINFTANTPAAGMTSQLLNWYEERSEEHHV